MGDRPARPIRFGTGPGLVSDRAALIEAGQSIERLGYATFAMADHFMLPFAPLLALQAVADATSTLRLTPTVLNQDFRHPAVLAKELATLDVLSGGRLEVGIGAGWMRSEYDQAGLRFDAAPARIERLEEVVVVLKGLFADGPFSFSGRHVTVTGLTGSPAPAQRPRPPIMIGGGGRRLLSVAGRQADIVQIMPRLSGGSPSPEAAPFAAETYAEKVDWVRAAAGDRFGEIELGAQLLNVTITDDREAGLDAVVQRFTRQAQRRGQPAPSVEELRSSPLVAVGSLDEVCATLLDTRDRLGISYFAAPLGATPESLAPVVERLSGK